MKETEKKQTHFLRIAMMVLTTILIVLFFMIMSMVGKIQGTARVINYAGLVRGGTQRMVKLEISGEPQDKMYETISSYIEGLRYGSDKLNFVRLADKNFQNKMDELAQCFEEELRSELLLVREKGYENTDIISKSEHFFQICDEAVSYAEVYSQKKATALDKLEKVVLADILGLVLIIGTELVKAVRFAAQNRILQKKVYLDEATGLPNKNKCEEILNAPDPIPADELVAMCVFDLNNLRTINNNLGHDKGDEYIRSFAIQLREAVPEEFFAGRDGGDEFIAVLRGLDHNGVRECLQNIRDHAAEYSRKNPKMPISYAAGYALSSDFDGCTMRELFRFADKNMYIDKNRAKMEEAAAKQKMNIQILENISAQGYEFSSCMYCDALLDQYYVLRSGSKFFLADDGSYSGAVEQIIQELSTEENRKDLRLQLQIEYLSEHLTKDSGKFELPYQYQYGENVYRGRMTLLYLNGTEDGRLHHFILGFETFQNRNENEANEKHRLARYYEQLRQSIVENGNYAEALLQTAHSVYTVDLTNDRLESAFYHTKSKKITFEVQTPCSYDDYCSERRAYITEDTMENYRIVDSSSKLLQRFETGSRQVTVEYREKSDDNALVWLQKTVLMSRDTVYDSKTNKESTVVHGIILFKNTSEFHEKEVKENERLKIAIEEADSENRAKTEFMNRMSHDIRTPINGIRGMIEIANYYKDDPDKQTECRKKIWDASGLLLELVNEVLDMGKLESGEIMLEEREFDLKELLDSVGIVVDKQARERGITIITDGYPVEHRCLLGSPLHLRRLLMNIISNAVKYNRVGGEIRLGCCEKPSADPETAQIEFTCADTGIGMSEEFQKHVFEPFAQERNTARSEYGGTGLGMPIAKSLAEKMGGTLSFVSRQGVGTTFTLSLPFRICHAPEKRNKPKRLLQTSSIAGLHVLVAEDNRMNMEIAEFVLNVEEASIIKAVNGEEAVRIFADSRPGEIDAILMDVMMPVMDGLEATRRIRAMKRPDARTIPIIAMTANAFAEDRQRAFAAGMDMHIAKPLEGSEMVETLERFVKSSRK